MADLTPQAAADRLGVSVRTLSRYVADGLLTPSRTRGGHRRFDAAEIDRVRAELAGGAFDRPAPPPRPTELHTD